MIEQPAIAFIDSGIGGLPYAFDFHKRSNWSNLIYLADHASFPYGEKRSTQLQQSLRETVRAVIERMDPRIIVLACNTASVTALAVLRQYFPEVEFVGVVPAIKPAAARVDGGGSIGLLVTERTAAGEYLNDMIGQFAPDQEVVTVVAGDLVRRVEQEAVRYDFSPGKETLDYIGEIVAEFQSSNIDRLVLGCTHFVYVRKIFEQRLGDGVTVLDSREGVTRRVLELSSKISESASGHIEDSVPIVLYTSSDKPLPKNTQVLLERQNVAFGGVL